MHGKIEIGEQQLMDFGHWHCGKCGRIIQDASDVCILYHFRDELWEFCCDECTGEWFRWQRHVLRRMVMPEETFEFTLADFLGDPAECLAKLDDFICALGDVFGEEELVRIWSMLSAQVRQYVESGVIGEDQKWDVGGSGVKGYVH